MAVTAIGLDIGSSAVRAVQVTAGRGPATLDRLGQVMLPAGAVRDGEIQDPPAVAEALRSLWSRYGFKGRRVALGLANQQVVVRRIDLPTLPEAELRASLQFQVQDAIPIPVDQAVLDYSVIDTYDAESGQSFTRLLLVAAQRQMVDKVLDVVRRAKLEAVGLDLAAFALLRSLAPAELLGTGQGELLVDVGASVTNLLIHVDGVPHFVRILLMGGNLITESLMGTLDMPFEQAEATKARIGLDDGFGPSGEEEASPLINERALRFVEEIRGSLDYYQTQPDAVRVERVILSGGASQLPNLRERLAETLRLPVERGHPMQELRIGDVGLEPEQLVESEPYLAVAIGLALGATT